MPQSGSVFSLNGSRYVFGTGDEGHLYGYDHLQGFSDSTFGFSDLGEIGKVLLYKEAALDQAILMNRNGFAKFDGNNWNEVLLKDLALDEEEEILDAEMFNDRVYLTTSAGKLASIGTDLTVPSYRKELNPLKNPIAQIAVTQDGRSIGLLDNTGSFYAGDAPIAARLSLVASGVADVKPMIDGYALRFKDDTVSIYGRGSGSDFALSFEFPVKVAAGGEAGFDAYGDSAAVVDASGEIASWNRNKFSWYSGLGKFTTIAGDPTLEGALTSVTVEKKLSW